MIVKRIVINLTVIYNYIYRYCFDLDIRKSTDILFILKIIIARAKCKLKINLTVFSIIIL